MLPCLPVCELIALSVNILPISTVVHMVAFVNLILKKRWWWWWWWQNAV